MHDQDKIKEEFYSELYNSEWNTIIYIDPTEVLEIIPREMEVVLRDMKIPSGNNYNYKH